ncbi:MAG: 3-dehydroquinate synthase [Turicibacter sp.]
MKHLSIQTDQAQYPIYVGKQTLTFLKPYIEKASKVVVISDENVATLHLEKLQRLLPQGSMIHVLMPGESSKSMSCYLDIQTELIKHHVDRYSLILAFGGGVVGDLAGFVAATYMRGIPYIQVPTTLLAHDSAIGGKVAINHELGKNLIGSFYPPQAVVYELIFLKTLADKEWRSGLGEMIKHGFIGNAHLLTSLLSLTSFDELRSESFEETLVTSLAVKQDLVEQDPFERGVRAYLNFGHTLGHGVELVHKELSHGEGVAIGIAFALYLSQQCVGLKFDLTSYLTFLQEFNYPIPLSYDKIEDYLRFMCRDKKNKNQEIRFVLLSEIEKPVLYGLSREETKQYLQQFLSMMH